MGKSKKLAASESSSSSSPKKSNETSIMLANGFLAVPVTIPNSKIGKAVGGEVKHWVYVRKHNSSSVASAVASTSKLSEDLPSERTLFVANLPTDTTESHLREVFAKAGNLSVVKFRRQASKEEEEDEREEMGEGEDEQEDEQMEEDEEEHHQLAAQSQAGLGKKKKKGAQPKKSRVPRIVPLPSLDPREAMGSQSFLATSSSAHIVFLDTQSFTRAMDLLKNGIRWIDPFRSLRKEASKQALLDEEESHAKKRATTSASFLLSSGAGIPPTGLEFLLDQYSLSRPSLPDIQAWANSRIALYQYRKAHPLPRKIGVRGVTVGPSGELLDEDGFIIVQRSGKYGRAGASAEGGGSVGVARHDFKENTKKKSVGLEDFYRFQLREKKREQLADLRAKFEADKEKVAKLKAGRRFKPY